MISICLLVLVGICRATPPELPPLSSQMSNPDFVVNADSLSSEYPLFKDFLRDKQRRIVEMQESRVTRHRRHEYLATICILDPGESA